MPISSFYCQNCSYEFDELLYSSDTEEVRCPKCNGQVKKVYSSFHVKTPDSFDSVPIGKIIREKNESLKRKYRP